MNKLLDKKTTIIYTIKLVVFCFLTYIANNMLCISHCKGEKFFVFGEKIFLMLVFIGITFVGLFKVEEFVAEYKQQFTKKSIVWTLVLSLSVMLAFNPLQLENVSVLNFNRVIGLGMVSDVDVEKAISNFMYFFILFAVFFSLCLLLMNHIRNKSIVNSDDCEKSLDKLFEISFVNLLLNATSFFSKAQSELPVLNYSLDILLLLIVAHLLFIVLKLNKKLDYSRYQQMICIIFCLCFPIAIILGKGELIKTYFLSVIVALGISILLLKILLKSASNSLLLVGVLFSAFCLPVTSVYIELVNIFNQYKIFISNPLLVYVIAMVIGLFCIVGFVCITKKKSFDWKKIVYPSIVLGLSCLSVQLPLQSEFDTSLFEGANSGVLISDFLYFEKIPIVEHYGGHMLSKVPDGILYGILNNDYSGAVFSPYSQVIVLVICMIFYYVLSAIMDEEYALLSIICLPFYEEWLYWGFGLISYFAIMLFVKRSSYKNAMLIWITCGVNVLYRLDLGVAFDVTVVIVLFFYLIDKRDKKALKMITSTFFFVILSVSIIWCILCIIKDINPTDRLNEFLAISASNQNWARESWGDVNLFVFAWSYFFVPLSVVMCILYIMCTQSFRRKIGDAKTIILLFLGTSYMINFSRTCVRHTVWECRPHILFWSAYLFIAFFIMCLFEKKICFVASYGLLLALTTSFIHRSNVNMNLLVDNTLTTIQDITSTWHKQDDNCVTIWEQISIDAQVVDRVVLSEEFSAQITPIENVLNILLDEQETYLDFVNKSLMYSITNRKCPVYVVQSPGHLSGEYTQEQYIKQIDLQKEEIPIVMMPAKQDLNGQNFEIELDSIANVVRYYKVAEYIYQNYRPLCIVKDVVLWAEVNRYNELQKKLFGDSVERDSYVLVDWGYDAAEEIIEEKSVKQNYCGQLHDYHLFNLPHIWANYDEKSAIENRVQKKLSNKGNGLFLINSVDAIQKEKGNYLLITGKYMTEEIENDSNFATIQLGHYQNGKFVEKCVGNFNLKPGKQNYLIRISADYYWYLNEINAIKFTNDIRLEEVEMVILEGD